MRSFFLATLLLSFKLVFGQAALVRAEQIKAPAPKWVVSKSFSGNDVFMDNAQSRIITLAWDKREGSPSMNGCDWLQSIWLGQTARLCTVESMGQVGVSVRWQGKGAVPSTVDVEVSSSVLARYQGAFTPTMLLSNGLGSRTAPIASLGANESGACGTKTLTLPVQNGVANLSFAISGRVSGMMSGLVALRSELKIVPR